MSNNQPNNPLVYTIHQNKGIYFPEKIISFPYKIGKHTKILIIFCIFAIEFYIQKIKQR